MKKIICIVLLMSMWVMVYGTTAARGVFTVAAGKTVQFADAKVATRAETKNLYQWSEAVAMQADGWTLLSNAEWSYLLAEGRTNASNLNSLGTINGENVLIILPDGWVKPDGVPAFSTKYTSDGFGANTYNSSTWALMEQSGAIYLPCGGYGHYAGGFVFDGDEAIHGTFWTSTGYEEDDAYCMRFHGTTIHDQNHAAKTSYRSVILVREVTVLDEEDEKDNFYTHWTAAKGKDYAYVHRTLKKDSTLYTLCLPFDVPDIEDSPLQGAEVFEFLGGHVGGSTGNEQLYLNMKRLNGKRLKQGVPYILRWAKTNPVQTLTKLCFYDVENWDEDTTTVTPHPGNENIKFRGVYPKTHIPDYTEDPVVAHYNFFLGANNTLYWPDKTTYGSSDMRGFRGYFYITPGGYPAPDPSPAPYRNMPVVWQIGDGLSSPTDTGYWTLDNGHCKKQLRNGQIILVIDGKEYDLQGKVIGN